MEAIQAESEVRRRGIVVTIFPWRRAGIEGQADVLRGSVRVGVEIEAEAGVLRNGGDGAGKNKRAQNDYLQWETEAIDHEVILLHTD